MNITDKIIEWQQVALSQCNSLDEITKINEELEMVLFTIDNLIKVQLPEEITTPPKPPEKPTPPPMRKIAWYGETKESKEATRLWREGNE